MNDKTGTGNLTCTVKYYSSPDELPGFDEAFYPLGGFDPAPDWEEYLAQYDGQLHPYLEVAKIWALSLREWPGASDFAAENFLEFSDGVGMVFSWRSFGDFLQAVAGKREGYLEYYIRRPNPLLAGSPEQDARK